MFCPNCGTEIEEGNFCPNCGNKVDKLDDSSNVSRQVPNQVSASQLSSSQLKINYKQDSCNQQKNANKNSKKPLIIGLSVAGALIIICVTILILFMIIGNKSVPVNLKIDIAEYDVGNSTKIPVQIDSDSTDELKFLSPNCDGFELKPGEYKISFPASPLCSNTNFYATPSDTYILTIKDGKVDIDNDVSIKFAKKDITQVSDSEIDNAVKIAKKDSQNATRVDEYAKKTKESRDKAIKDAEDNRKAQQAAEEAANKKAQFKNKLITSDYVLEGHPDIIMHLDMENRHFTIKQNGNVLDDGEIYDSPTNKGISRDGYGITKIQLHLKSGNNFLEKTENGFKITPGAQIMADAWTFYNINCNYILK